MTSSNPQSAPLSSDLQEILEDFTKQNDVNRFLYYKHQREAVKRLEALIQSRERAAENKGRISELRQLDPPKQYKDIARLMGTEACNICGFSAIRFSEVINDRIATLSNNEGENNG